MARRTTEEHLEELSRLSLEQDGARVADVLKRALRRSSAAVIARAAKASADLDRQDLLDDLLATYLRLSTSPARSDPGCRAKTALASALDHLEIDDMGPFEHGIRHVQQEPVWGGTVDTAAELRAVCAGALARRHHPRKLILLADLLADPEAVARTAAGRALGHAGDHGGLPLLRLKVRTGDPEAEVLSECFAAMLELNQEPDTLEFVTSHLNAPEVEVREAAGLALGESRLAAAFAPLADWCERSVDSGERRSALLALALLRNERAIDLLVSMVARASGRTAIEAVGALRLYRGDEKIEHRVHHAARERGDQAVMVAANDVFS